MERVPLRDKVAIVTGAGHGTGRAVAIRLALSGARVVINDLDEVRAAKTQATIQEAGGNSVLIPGSVVDSSTAQMMVKLAWERWSRLDILVNSTSVSRNAFLHDMSDEWFGLVVGVLLKGAFHCIRAAAPVMQGAFQADSKAGRNVHRKIINITSTAGIYGAAGKSNYCAANAALIGLTKATARELFLVNCSAVAPGILTSSLETEHRSENDRFAAMGREFAKSLPFGRRPTAEDVAGVVGFLRALNQTLLAAACSKSIAGHGFRILCLSDSF